MFIIKFTIDNITEIFNSVRVDVKGDQFQCHIDCRDQGEQALRYQMPIWEYLNWNQNPI